MREHRCIAGSLHSQLPITLQMVNLKDPQHAIKYAMFTRLLQSGCGSQAGVGNSDN